MKILALFLLTGICSATITPIGGTTGSGSTQAVPLTYSATSGNEILGATVIAGDQTYAYWGDNNLHTLFPGPQISDGSTVSLGLFYGFASSGFTSAKGNYFSASPVKASLEELSGGLSFNSSLTGNTATGTGTSPSFSVTTEDNNDAVFCVLAAATGTFSAPSGTVLQTTTSPPSISFLVTVASPGTATCSATNSSSVNWVGGAIEIRTVANTPLWPLIAITPSGYSFGTVGCSRNTTTCTFQVPQIGIGHVLVVLTTDHVDANSGTSVTLSSIYDCTSSSGCNSGNAINSWVIPAGAHATATGSGSYTENVNAAYVLSSTPGGTYITGTRSSNVTNEQWSMTLFEIAPASPAAIDGITSAFDNSATTSHTLTTATVTSNDIVFQGYAGGGNHFPTPPYRIAAAYSHQAFFYATTNDGTAPTVSNVTVGPAAGCAISLKIPGGAPAKCASCDMSEVIYP